jgi:hypothetical protein
MMAGAYFVNYLGSGSSEAGYWDRINGRERAPIG